VSFTKVGGSFPYLHTLLIRIPVSSPSNSRYGKHLTPESVHELIRPAQEASDLVHEWLADHGISNFDYTPGRDWIKVNLPVSTVEKLLDTEYHTFQRSEDGAMVVRTDAWSVPRHLHDHISTIQPTNSFFLPKIHAPVDKRESHAIAGPAILDAPSAPVAGGSVDEVCDYNLVTPTCVRTLYKTLNYTVQSADKNTMAFTNYLGEINVREDAKLMLEKYRPEAAGEAETFKKISINGGVVSDVLNATQLKASTGLEGNLDTQAMISIGWPTPLVSYSTGGSPPIIFDAFTTSNTNEPYLTWLDWILAQPDPLPSVISTSYGDDEQTIPKDYAKSVCEGFAQLGARGVTLFFSSGDNGVGEDGYCYSNDGRNTSTFLPAFPASCPYVTTVGGTMKSNPEVAVYRARPGRPIFSAGGGFSYYFEAPDYQKEAVAKYIKDTVDPLGYDGLFDPNGRGYPDIAGQALNYSTYWNGTLKPISGTSMSSPLVAAVFSLVNDALIAAGKPVLGFLNPWIYEKGYNALNDILSGSAAGCGTEKGLPAAEGWDAVTGYGTPDFEKILELLGAGQGWSDN
jgi:tripeptidyl-peptidase I